MGIIEYTSGDWQEDFSHENGNYVNKCVYCDSWFRGYKRRVVCKKCHTHMEDILKPFIYNDDIFCNGGIDDLVEYIENEGEGVESLADDWTTKS